MKNRILLVFLAVVLVVSLAAFAACKAEEAPPVEEVWEWPDKLIVGAVGTEDRSYGAAIGWTTPLAETTRMKVRVVCQSDARIRHLWLKQGVLSFSSLPKSGMDMIRAEEQYATRDVGPWQTTAVYPAGRVDQGYATTPDSGIRTPYDIKPGTKIIYMSFMPAGKMLMEALLAWGQVDPEDVEWVPAGSIGANVRHLMEGKGDITFGWTTESSLFYEAEAAPRGLSWIALDAKADPEGAKRYSAVYTTGTFGVIALGVPSAQGVPGLSSLSPYLTRAESDPELVYHLVKWLDENYDKFKDSHPTCRAITMDSLLAIAETSWQPLHEGTVRYLEEKGLWTPAHEVRRQQNADLIARYIEAWEDAIDMADERGITVNPENEEWLELWYSYRDKLPVFSYFVGLD